MADTALGELRRPPRNLNQRIERLARGRAEGLANGANDALFPSGVTDSVVFAASGGSDAAATTAPAPRWEYDTFALTASTTNSFALAATPLDKSEVVRVNGLVLTRAEYTITGSTLTFTDLDAARLGIGADTWTIALNYAYYDLAAPGTTEDAVAALGAWGYWKLDEPASLLPDENVVDYSGNNRHGYYDISTPALLDQDPIGAGLSRSTRYDGSQDAVQIDHAQTTFDNGFTVTALQAAAAAIVP